MNLTKKNITEKMTLFLLGILLLQLVSSASPETLNQQPAYNCSAETLPLQIQIIELSTTLNQTQTDLNNYKNLSSYYKFLYESKEINITNRELIQIFNTLNNVNFNVNETNQNITNLKQEITKFKLDVGFYAFGGSLLGFSIVELIIWCYKRRKENEQPSGT